MIEVIGVSFSDSNKIYYFLFDRFELKKDDKVIVATERGEQFGTIVTNAISIDPKQLVAPLKNILRVATKDDETKHRNNLADAEKALKDASTFITELGLEMTILNATFTFDKKQLLFNFLSEDRVDFRSLAKKLARVYKTRIELRQIGVRDKAKEVGGIGQCGRKLCCAGFLKDLNSVSINMAKNQNISLTPQKINGVCGRLMCCLDYENSLYDEYKKGLPKINETVSIKEGKGRVISIDIFKRSYKVQLDDVKVIEVEV